MTASQDTHEPVTAAQDYARGRPTSRHRAVGPAASRRGPSGSALTALAVIPAVCAALLGVIAVVVLLRASGNSQPLHGSTLAIVSVLGVLALAVVVVGFTWAGRLARSSGGPVAPAVDYGYGYGYMAPPAQAQPAAPAPAAAAATTVSADKGVFVHLSHRLQSLVHRQIQLLDELENDVEEPDLLKGLFGVDHLATRMRRHAENLAVLGGAVPRRQWTKPVSVMEVLRSSVSETLDYARVQVIARTPGSLNGYAVADVIHLLAELVENATSFSPPETRVVLRTQAVAAGLAIEIDDRGLGMSQPEYERLNALLKEPAQISVQELLEGARIGLYVVAQLARRHGIAVHLQTNITGGTQALVVLPKSVLAAEPRQLTAGPQQSQQSQTTASAPAPAPAQPQQQQPQTQPQPQPQAQAPAPAPAPPAPQPPQPQQPQPVPATAARASAPVSEPGEDLGGMPKRPATSRPMYGADGVLPSPRRPMNGPVTASASAPAPAPPADRSRLTPLDGGMPAPAAGSSIRRPPMYGSEPASAPSSTSPEPLSRPEPAGSSATSAHDDAPRRPLPRRRPQEHLAAPLAHSTADMADVVGDGLTPNLMADFKRGLALGATEPPRAGEHPHEHAPNQEG